MDHLENQQAFYKRLEELREKKHNKQTLKELEEMEKDLSRTDLAPYSYQVALKKQKNVSPDSRILLFYFYNSINK